MSILRGMSKITIKEIARLAGVSVGTVDRVLHNRGSVAPQTKELILSIARKNNYSTNIFARSLKLNKTYNLAVLLPNDNEYWRSLAGGIGRKEAEYEQLGLRLGYFTFNRQDKGSFLASASKAIAAKPSGLILAPLLREESWQICRQLREHGIPFVFVDSNLPEAGPLAFIGQDTFKGGYLAAKLLNFGFSHGHDAFIVTFKEFDSFNKTINERIEGFRAFYRDHALPESLVTEISASPDVRELTGLFKRQGPVHFFLPNSRAHQVIDRLAPAIERYRYRVVGFDLIAPNKACLHQGLLDFIIDQNPALQGELSVQAFYHHFITRDKIEPQQQIQLTIYTKENLMP